MMHLTYPLLGIAVGGWFAWISTRWKTDSLSSFFAENRKTVALLLGLAAWALVFLQSYRRYYWYGATGKDMGLFHQTHWLLSRFEAPYNTVMGMNAFADHMEFIDFAAAPLQWLWPRAEMLLLFQSACVALGAVGVLVAARRTLGTSPSLALALTYLFAIDMQNAAMFDWNPATCGVALLPWAVWAFECERPWFFAASLAALALSKENLILYGIGLCLALAFQGRRRRALTGAVLLGLWFAVEMKWIFPLFRPAGFRHLRFEELGGSAAEIAANVLRHPWHAFQLLFTPRAKLDGLLTPFSSVAYLLLLAPQYLLALLPTVLERFWSTHENRWWGYHYGAGAAAFAVLGAAAGIARLSKIAGTERPWIVRWASSSVLASCLIVAIFHDRGMAPLFQWKQGYWPYEQDRIATDHALAVIPPDASVAAQNQLIAHLGARHALYEIKEPITADYVALQLHQGAWPFDDGYPRALASKLLAGGEYGVDFCEGPAIVLERGLTSKACPILDDSSASTH